MGNAGFTSSTVLQGKGVGGKGLGLRGFGVEGLGDSTSLNRPY